MQSQRHGCKLSAQRLQKTLFCPRISANSSPGWFLRLRCLLFRSRNLDFLSAGSVNAHKLELLMYPRNLTVRLGFKHDFERAKVYPRRVRMEIAMYAAASAFWMSDQLQADDVTSWPICLSSIYCEHGTPNERLVPRSGR